MTGAAVAGILGHGPFRGTAAGGDRVAGEDDPLIFVRIAVRPLARPPFPLDLLSSI